MFKLNLRRERNLRQLKHLVPYKTMRVSSGDGAIGWTRPFKIRTESTGFYAYVWEPEFHDLLSSLISTRLKIELGQEI